MRRQLPVVLAALLAALLLLPVGAAAADVGEVIDQAATADQPVLAAEEGDEPVGPSPNPSTTHAPAEYEPPFLSNAAVGLTALLLGGVVVLAGLYYLLVVRPRRAE